METLEIIIIVLALLLAGASIIIWILVNKLDLNITLKTALSEAMLLQYKIDDAILNCKTPVYFRTEDCKTYNHYNAHTVTIKDTDKKVIMIDLINVKNP